MSRQQSAAKQHSRRDPRMTPEHEKKALRLVSDGIPAADVARRFNVGKKVLRAALARARNDHNVSPQESSPR